jgi:hypothetical protein
MCFLCLFTYSGVQYFVLSNVFTFIVPCCDVRSDFCIKTTFGSSLPPVVCRRAHVLFMLFVFVYIYSGVQYIDIGIFYDFIGKMYIETCFRLRSEVLSVIV